MSDIASSETRTPDRGSARRQAFLAAARTEFLARGYEAANVNEVVRNAGGSLATLYAQFGNKEGLFRAVMEEQHDRFVADFSLEDVEGLSLEQGLEFIGLRMMHAFLKPDNIAFYRIIIGEGAKFPQLLQRFIGASGADRVRNAVSGYLARHATSDGRRVADPDAAASFLFELMRGRHHYRSLADASYSPSDEELLAHVRAGVRVLLRGAFN